VQNGALSITTEDIVRLVLLNNRDVIVNRLTPISSFYSITALNRPFEPNFHIIANVNRANSPSRSQLSGAASLLSLTHDYTAGIDQTLQTGTIYSIDFDLNRSSSNSAFNLFNPSYTGLITYSMTQHVLRDFGRQVNAHQISIARNNEKISKLQFETQIMDLITQAQQSYWDLVFANEDVKVKQRSLDLASKTLQDNRIQVEVGTLAPIDLVQAEAEVTTRNEDELGTSTVRFVLEEQRNLAQPETDEIQALINYTKALIAYDRAIGSTLERNNIELEKQLPKQVTGN